jgi:hypothetical protein
MLGIVNALRELEINSDLTIDNNAYRLLQIWQNNLLNESIDASPQVGNKIKKLESEVVKMAGILHYYFLIVDPDKISHPIQINAEIMGRAIVLGNYYLRHFTYAITKCQGDYLEGKVMKILELVKKKGEISSVQVKQFIRDFRNTPLPEVNNILLSLVELGRVEQIPTNKGVKVKSI